MPTEFLGQADPTGVHEWKVDHLNLPPKADRQDCPTERKFVWILLPDSHSDQGVGPFRELESSKRVDVMSLYR